MLILNSIEYQVPVSELGLESVMIIEIFPKNNFLL